MPRAGHARSRRPRRSAARRPAGRFPEVRHQRPMLVALERVQPRRAAGVRRPGAQGPRPRRRARARRRPDLRRGAQDRRPRGLAALRARPVHARRHPRRRLDRRGRDAQPAHDPRDPRAPHRARDARGARRGVHAQGGVRADQRRARGAGPRAVRQPAQQRRGLAPPEGPAGHGGPPAHDVAVPARRGRAGRRQRSRRPSRGSRRSASRSTPSARRASTSRA